VVSKRGSRVAAAKARRHPTKAWERWEREKLSLKRLLNDLATSGAIGGEKWRASMIKHYTVRLHEHIANEPDKYS